MKIIRPHSGPQEHFVSCPIEEIFFGGSRGPGKTFGVLLKWIQHASLYKVDANGIILRRRYTDLRDLIRESTRLFVPLGGKFNKGNSQWTFPKGPMKGATLTLAHAWDLSDISKYQGWSLNWIFFEELTNWPEPEVYLLMLASARSSTGVKIRFGATGNPGGPGHCLVPHSGVLTPNGWRNIEDFKVGDSVYTVNESGEMVETKVSQVHKHYHVGDVVRVNARGLSMEMTPNHSVPKFGGTKKDRNRLFSLVPFEDLPGQANILRSASWVGQPISDFSPSRIVTRKRKLNQPQSITGKQFASLLGWFLSEGCVVDRDKAFSIAQIKYKDEVRSLLNECGFIFSEGECQFTVYAADWYAYFKQFGKCRDKFIPKWVKNSSIEDLAVLLKSMMNGDGHWCSPDSGTYFTISKQLADDVCEIATKLGYLVYMSQRQRINRNGISYQVNFKRTKNGCSEINTGHHIYDVDTQKKRKSDITREHYEGWVYCLGIEDTHTFIVRQNGCVWISGNSWVKRRFVDPCVSGYKVIEDSETGMRRIFIPATLEDNPTLMEGDPTYERRLRSLGNSTMVRAWRYGEWNITSSGFFDDIWTPDLHILPRFKIPAGWRLSRSFDWGDASPASLGEWGMSDGTPVVIPGRGETKLPKGSLVRLREMYVCQRDTAGVGSNKGLRWGNARMGAEIGSFSKRMVYTSSVADPSIFNRQGNESIYEQMAKTGCGSFRPAVNERIEGWQKMRDMLRAASADQLEVPGMWVMENCVDFIRTVPTLQMDLKHPDDIDTTLEDHAADESRYMVNDINRQIIVKRTVGF